MSFDWWKTLHHPLHVVFAIVYVYTNMHVSIHAWLACLQIKANYVCQIIHVRAFPKQITCVR